MAAKTPSAAFEAVFERPGGLFPEEVPVGFLSRILSAMQRLALGEAADVSGTLSDDSRIGLLRVKRGSAVYQFAAPKADLALQHLRVAGRILDDPETIGESDYVLHPVEELSAVARSLDCRITIREPGDRTAVLARIEPDSYQAISRRLIITDEATITGKVMRVGGATQRKCGLRIPSQHRMLYCTVQSNQVARKLGQKLYQDVVVRGDASWLKTTWRIVRFEITEVSQPKLGRVQDAIQALRDAGGKAWDEIEDPESFLEELSGER